MDSTKNWIASVGLATQRSSTQLECGTQYGGDLDNC